MNIFQRLQYAARFFRNLGLNDPKAWDPSLWNLAGAQSPSGEVVNESTALTYAAVWCATELISSAIAALPLNLMQGQGASKRIAEDYRLQTVMHNRWNPVMTAKRGRQTLISHVLLWGNGYAEIVRNGYGDAIELWPITPDRVTPKMEDGRIVYSVRMPQEAPVVLPKERILHLMGPSPDGFVGYSRIALARKSIGLGMAMETFGAHYFGKGTHPSGTLTMPAGIKTADMKAYREARKAVYAGLGNTHELMVLEHGEEFKNVAIPPEDSQFLESRQFQIPEIARWFNLPPHKLKDLTRSSFNNIESEDASFLRDRILPDLVELEQDYDMQLLTDADRNRSGRGKLYFKHNVKGLLRADTATRSTFYREMLDRGVFSINEVRELEDMEPVKGGDIRLVPLNMTTLENAGKQPAPAPAPAALPAPPPGKGNGKDRDQALLITQGAGGVQ